MTGTARAAAMPLAAVLWPQRQGNRLLRRLVLAAAGAALLTLCSKIYVPLWPVPITMQTFALLVIGMAYGWRLGVETVLLYLAVGLAGVPVFAGPGAGPAVLLGTTGGYLVGWVFAVALVGWLAERGWDRRLHSTAAAMLAGNAVIYLFGLPWLAVYVGLAQAVPLGLVPFLVGDALKLVLAAVAMPIAWRLAGMRLQ